MYIIAEIHNPVKGLLFILFETVKQILLCFIFVYYADFYCFSVGSEVIKSWKLLRPKINTAVTRIEFIIPAGRKIYLSIAFSEIIFFGSSILIEIMPPVISSKNIVIRKLNIAFIILLIY